MTEPLNDESVLRRCALPALVVTVVLAVFWPVLSASALFIDDTIYLAENPLVQDPGWASAWRCLTEVAAPSSVRGYYHPVGILSLMLDCALGGRLDNLGPFHRTNLVLHLINVVLVIALLGRLAIPRWAACLSALVFGVHPMTVETVAWIGERKALLAGTFGLASLYFYVEYVRAQKATRTVSFYVASMCATVLALMSRPSSVAVPFLAIVLDWWPLKRVDRLRWIDKVPWITLCTAAFIVTLVSHTARVGVQVVTSTSWVQMPLTAAHKLVLLAKGVVWPFELTPWHVAPEPIALSNPRVLAAVVICSAWFAAIVVLRRRAPAFSAGSAWFVIGVAPTLGFIQYSIVYTFDNYAYLPLVGLALPLAVVIVTTATRSDTWRPLRVIGPIALGLAVCVEIGLARRQLGRWHDTETLYRYMLSLTPDAAMLHSDLGLEFERQGRPEDARKEHQLAIQLDPSYARAQNNLGLALSHLNRVDEAIAAYRQSIQLDPGLAEVHNNLGAALQSLGQLDEAVLEHRSALALRPDWADAHSNLGVALFRLGRTAEALASFEEAVRWKPDFADAFNNRGVCELELGRREEALRDYARAVALSPRHVNARRNLAEALAEQGRTAESIEQFREILRLTPDNHEASERLDALLKLGAGH